LSIAREYDLDVYILSLTSVDNDLLHVLFTELPVRCVVLVEDIDTANATYSREQRTVKPGQDHTSSSDKEKQEGEVSLSALLNTINSVGLQEGRLLIMTTNHIEHLDPH
jgi:mitochondrial chaperone BCS1